MSAKDEMLQAVERYGDSRYAEGLDAGLEAAERIYNWMSKLRDSDRKSTIRRWSRDAIDGARQAKK